MDLKCFTKLLEEKIQKGDCLESHQSLLKQYDGDDWKKYKKFTTEVYYKNPVYVGENFDVFVISWNSKSPIHNHAKNGCIFKVLSGRIIESI